MQQNLSAYRPPSKIMKDEKSTRIGCFRYPSNEQLVDYLLQCILGRLSPCRKTTRRLSRCKARLPHRRLPGRSLHPPLYPHPMSDKIEVTMGLLARRSRIASRQNLPTTPQTSGYIGEFVTYVLDPLLPQILQNGTRVITNAGGLDPLGLKCLIETHLEKNAMGDVKVAAVWGDDLLPLKSELFRQQAFEQFDPLNGIGKPETQFTSTDDLLSLNAYIGAAPIVHALNSGAQIIITGRIVDSALVLAPLAYTYNWDLSPNSLDLDLIASASLAGHIIECGAQCTGGNFTDWRESAFSPYGGWSNMGYPIIEFHPNGTFVVTKPAKTGGIVTKLTVAEQMLYEVLDPSNYLLPDVNLDISQVILTEIGMDKVHVSGAKGRPPTPWLKCTAIKQDGYRIDGTLIIPGIEARQKSLILGEALIQRANRILKAMNMKGITEYRIETPGAEEMFGYYFLNVVDCIYLFVGNILK